MSREGRSAGAVLRLLGSPVQLATRDGGSATSGGSRRNRPRSAATRASKTPDQHERSRRPFSADTKPRSCSIRNFLKSKEHCDINIHDYEGLGDEVKIAPPTTALLENHNGADSARTRPSDLHSNPSDHGSEDTFISLGTEIKAKAQINNTQKLTNKNYLKYRDIAKKVSKKQHLDNNSKDDDFDLKVMISEYKTDYENISRKEDRNEEEEIMKKYESYFIPLESKDRNLSSPTNSLAGRVSFGKGSLHSEVENSIDIYSRRLNRQQLSLVEEESTQDLESVPSQLFSSLPPQASLDKTEDKPNNQEIIDPPDTGRGTYVVNSNDVKLTPRNNIQQSVLLNNNSTLENGTRTYDSFYDDFAMQIDSRFNRNNDTGLSSTVLNDSRPCNSMYADIAPVLPITCNSSLTEYSRNIIKNIDKNLNVKSDGEQHSSLECIALENMAESRSRKLSPQPTCQWNESPGHSRLLCKEFFSIKESDAANRANVDNDNFNAKVQNTNIELTDNNVNLEEDYPQYLSNSKSKAYTSKVIEDYKKEIQAIDNLHELTLKDIKVDCVSPTPLNIDFMFEQAEDSHKDAQTKKYDDLVKMDKKLFNKKNNCSNKNHEVDVSKISTKELIQNYFRVKEGEPKQSAPKTPKKKLPEKSTDRKGNNSTESSINGKPWSIPKNPLSKQRNGYRSPSPVHKKNNTASETNIPHSSRINCVQNDKDVDSWMSISSSTPKHFPCPSNPNNSPQTSEAGSDNAIETKSGTFPPEPTDSKKNLTEISPTANYDPGNATSRELHDKSTVLDIYSMLKEIEGYGEKPVVLEEPVETEKDKEDTVPQDNFMEIFTFLEKVEHSANEAISLVTSSAPQVVPKLETLLRLPQTELAQRYVTAALQLEERSCCIALLQESLTNHKEQMINKINCMERQSSRNIGKVKQDCEEAVKRHQSFIDQLISDKKTLNHRIEQLVDERRALEERWGRSAQALEQRYRLELKNQHDRMTAAQQVARQRWVRQKAEKIKELTVKGLEGELREMAERAATEVSQLRLSHAESVERLQAQHAAGEQRLRLSLQQEHEAALAKERRLASSRMEKQIVELEASYAEQRTRLVADLRAENERAAAALEEREKEGRAQLDKWRQEQEREMEAKMAALNEEIVKQREVLEEQVRRKREAADEELEAHKRRLEAEQQREVKRRVEEAAAAHRAERDRDIERAIESMEAEAQRGRRDLQDALRRNKEQYETELNELGETERATLRRYQEAQARVRHTEDKCAEMEATISQLEMRNRALTDKSIQLEAAQQAARREGEEAQSAAVDALRAELDNLKRTHEEQMHQLYAKVKVAVARKDSAIQALTREGDKAQEKITLLEHRLQQYRKDFLKHK